MAGREVPEDRNQKERGCCVRWESTGLSGHIRGVRGDSLLGSVGLAASITSNVAVTGSSLLSSPGSLSKWSPLNRMVVR